MYHINDFEIMAPAGSRESLAAALQAGAGSVYFGIESLNMRARSASPFTIADLKDIAATCRDRGVKSYLTLNTIIYDQDLDLMRRIVDAAREAGISAVIAADVAVMEYCRRAGQEVHLSTQLNISNAESLAFYARYADVVVLARELDLAQVAGIRREILRRPITGPSLHNLGASANRGACMQVCRRAYEVRDKETGMELEVDNQYIMSPKDLKTIHFLDRMAEAGVRVFKIEGRARGPEYVHTVVGCYREALEAIVDGSYGPERVREWDERLARVFNRGFWDGYYLGQRLGEWSAAYGSQATERKVYAGRAVKYFSRLGVGEFRVEAAELHQGDRLLVTGPTTGAMYLTLDDPRVDLRTVDTVAKGEHVSFRVPGKVRPSDKLYRIVPAGEVRRQ